MRFWFVHSDEVTIHEQIVTQISLGILSGELAPGERLPSIRDLARRFHLHPNTVSLAYRRLERERWVDLRRGSGVYVREAAPHQQVPPDLHHLSGEYLDQLIVNLVQASRALRVGAAELHKRLTLATTPRPTRDFLLIEPDPDLRNIIAAELGEVLTSKILTSTFPFPENGSQLENKLASALPIVLPSKAEVVRAALPAAVPLHTLRIRSVPQSLQPWLPAPPDTLVAVVSHWPNFLEIARTMLVAAGLHPDTLLLRDARQPGWRDGLNQVGAIVCDTFTAKILPPKLRIIPFQLLADESIAELRRHEQPAAPASAM
jgi:DNA-binding transcriptional regulator YhcF (GntR family)